MTACGVQIASIAGVAGYPTHKTSLIKRLAREGSVRLVGVAARGQKGFFYEVSSLRAPLRDALLAAGAVKAPEDRPDPLAAYQRAPASQKQEAERRLRMVRRVKAMLADGAATGRALAAVAAEFECSVSAVKSALKAIQGVDEGAWLAALVKGYKGRQAAPIAPELWRIFVADYGRVERPALIAAYERTCKEAARRGLGPVPSAKTFARAWARQSRAEQVFMRDGEKALAATFPHIERDRSSMKPMDGANVDGREWDVAVRWPDGREGRPVVTMVQDEATGFLLGWIVADVESADIYRRVLCDVFTTQGVPRRITFDNTRAAANKALTAGAKGRHRFKDRADDIMGLLPRIGCDPRFAIPENGRSKLVERAFAELKERSEKDPRMAGAYTGRSPSEKPANYGECAVPVELFKTVLVEAVTHFNTRVDRRGKVAFKTSYRALFEQGLAETSVRKLSDAQRRLFFTIAAARKVSPSGEVRLGKRPHEARYWSPALRDHAGEIVVVRFDPDNLNAPVLVETRDERLIDPAVPAIAKTPFHSTAHLREHNCIQRAERKRIKASVEAQRRLAELERGPPLPEPDVTPAAHSPVVAPLFKTRPTRAPDPLDAETLKRGMDRMNVFRRQAG